MVEVPSNRRSDVLAFVRADERSRVFVVLNLCTESRSITFTDTLHHGTYRDFATDAGVEIDASSELTLGAWGYRVLVG